MTFMSYVMIWDPLERFFWAVAIVLLIIVGIVFLKKGLQSEQRNEKLLLFGFSGNFFCSAVTRFLFYLSDLQFIGYYKNNIIYGDMSHISAFSQILDRLGYLFGLLGFMIFLLMFEITIKRTKYIITFIDMALFILHLIFPYELTRVINQFSTIFVSVLFFFTLLYFTERARQEFKAISAFLLCGFDLILVGSIFYGNDVKALNTVPLIFAPLIYNIGIIIWLVPIFIDPKHISKARLYWAGFGGLLILVHISMIFISLFYGLPFYYTISATLLLVFVSYLIYKIIDLTQMSPKLKDIGKGPNILNMFVRPQKLTEEEISISKEKKICLVCKSKISREIYMCPKCNSFYCLKCSRTLATLENACWSCSAQFDESKPTKSIEKEEFKVEPMENIHKKKN